MEWRSFKIAVWGQDQSKVPRKWISKRSSADQILLKELSSTLSKEQVYTIYTSKWSRICGRAHTHTHTQMDRDDLWLIEYRVYNRYKISCGTIEHTHLSFIWSAHYRKTRGKHTYTSDKSQKHSTMTAANMHQMLLLHYRQCSFCKRKDKLDFWRHQNFKLDHTNICIMSNW